MELVPTEEEVISLLRQTGALRSGHFACPGGFHSNQYLETQLVMRHYRHAKTLSVGLSRLVRANAELRAMIPELSIVAATPAGVPVAYGLCEALHARQVYWAEKPLRFRQYLQPARGEKALLVDDILRAGVLLQQAKTLLESYGAAVVALAVLVHQPTPRTRDFSPLPLYSLARVKADYYAGPGTCELCRQGLPLERIGSEAAIQDLEAPVTTGAF